MSRWRALVVLGLVAPATRCAGCGSDPNELSPDAGDDVTTDVLAEVVLNGDAAVDACATAGSNHDVLGCDYVIFDVPAGDAPSLAAKSYGCTALLISNPGDTPATITLIYKGSQRDLSVALELVSSQGLPFAYQPASNGVVPAGGSAVLAAIQGDSASNDPNQGIVADCPFSSAVGTLNVTAPADATTTGLALHSSVPVLVTYVDAYGLDPEWLEDSVTATTLRGVESWDTRYRDVGLLFQGAPRRRPTAAVARTIHNRSSRRLPRRLAAPSASRKLAVASKTFRPTSTRFARIRPTTYSSAASSNQRRPSAFGPTVESGSCLTPTEAPLSMARS